LCTLALQAQPQKLLEQADSLSRLNQYEAANEKLIAFIKAYPQRKYDLGEAY
jgi:TolA-binding protein